MPIVQARDHVEVYRRRARHEPLSTLSGRYETSTAFVAANALDALDLPGAAALLDIGCGDGTLLTLAEPAPARRVGVVPTEEEAEALRSALPDGVGIVVGRAESLPRDLEGFDRVVINGVLLLLPDAKACAAALAEVARVSVPGALVWAGEIVVEDEIAARGGKSNLARLGKLVAQGRLRSLLRRLKRLWQGVVLGREVTLVPKALLSFRPDEFAALCASRGFEVLDIREHFEQTRDGRIHAVPSRKDFLLRRN